MRNWEVKVRTIVETWFSVEAESEEDAKREALCFADCDDLNDWTTVDMEVGEIK